MGVVRNEGIATLYTGLSAGLLRHPSPSSPPGLRIRTFFVGSGAGSGNFSPDLDPYLSVSGFYPYGTLAM